MDKDGTHGNNLPSTSFVVFLGLFILTHRICQKIGDIYNKQNWTERRITSMQSMHNGNTINNKHGTDDPF
jgi:hypothetical protein